MLEGFAVHLKLGYCFFGMANPHLNMGVGERFKGTAEKKRSHFLFCRGYMFGKK